MSEIDELRDSAWKAERRYEAILGSELTASLATVEADGWEDTLGYGEMCALMGSVVEEAADDYLSGPIHTCEFDKTLLRLAGMAIATIKCARLRRTAAAGIVPPSPSSERPAGEPTETQKELDRWVGYLRSVQPASSERKKSRRKEAGESA